jgi:hypothetical protein
VKFLPEILILAGEMVLVYGAYLLKFEYSVFLAGSFLVLDGLILGFSGFSQRLEGKK